MFKLIFNRWHEWKNHTDKASKQLMREVWHCGVVLSFSKWRQKQKRVRES